MCELTFLVAPALNPNIRARLFPSRSYLGRHWSLVNLVHLHGHLARWRIWRLPDRVMNLDIEFPRISLTLFAIKRARDDGTYTRERRCQWKREKEKEKETGYPPSSAKIGSLSKKMVCIQWVG